MNPKPDNRPELDDCSRLASELTLVACGEKRLDAASPTLRRHVHGCVACAELLRDAALFMPALSDALSPPPLSPSVVARVESLLAPRRPQPRILRLPTWRAPVAPVAAAAAVALFAVWGAAPRQADRPATGAPATPGVRLSPADAAEIAAAFGLVQWDDVFEISLASAASDVTELEQSLDRDADAESLLPWSAEEDWDLPPPPAGSRAQPPPATREVASLTIAFPAAALRNHRS